MNKEKYILELKNLLIENNVIIEDVNSITLDYEELYDDAIKRGLSDLEIYNQLGNQNLVYQQLKGELNYYKKGDDKIVALSPFIAMIIFFTLGFAFSLWNYAWLSFLLVPIIAVIVNVKGANKIVALSPFISFIVFYLLGIAFNLWHPGWLVFFIIPITGILANVRGKEVIYGLGTFLVIITFVMLMFVNVDAWKYNLLVLLLIPFCAYLFKSNKLRNLIGVGLILLSAITYLLMLKNNIEFKIAVLVFVVPVIFGFINGDIKVMMGYKTKNHNFLVYSIITTIVIYLAVSLIFGKWNMTWLILLLIPMLGIYSTEGFKHKVAFMPFIATIIFILLGNIFDAWQYAWMAYLLIPIVGIIESDKHKSSNDARFDTGEE